MQPQLSLVLMLRNTAIDILKTSVAHHSLVRDKELSVLECSQISTHTGLSKVLELDQVSFCWRYMLLARYLAHT
jgi:hypothetical protein